MKKVLIAASVAALALTSCRENDSLVESSNFGMNAVSAADYNVTGLPVTAVKGDITTNTTVTPRNTGDFQGTWTKYTF